MADHNRIEMVERRTASRGVLGASIAVFFLALIYPHSASIAVQLLAVLGVPLVEPLGQIPNVVPFLDEDGLVGTFASIFYAVILAVAGVIIGESIWDKYLK